MFEIGALGGVLATSDRHALFQSGVAEQRPLQPAGVVGLRVAYHPIRWVGLELENAFMAARTDVGGARFFALGGHVVGQLPYRVTPLVTMGGGATVINSATDVLGRDVDAEFHFGTGVKFFAHPRVSVRLDLRDYVMPGLEETLTHNLRVTAGVGVVFGRHGTGRPPHGGRR